MQYSQRNMEEIVLNETISVLFAAGKGTRLLPLTESLPKPLIKVHGTPLIETSITAMIQCGIRKIYIVVGYKKEQFFYLEEKYPEVTLIENPEYDYKNNISSFYAMGDLIGKKDCFICDSDLYIANPSVFSFRSDCTCYYGKYTPGKTSEWSCKVVDGQVVHYGQGGENDYSWVGVTYWKAADIAFLKEAICAEYQKPGHEQLYWDVYAGSFFDRMLVRINPISEDDIIEIDTLDDLRCIDKFYENGNI